MSQSPWKSQPMFRIPGNSGKMPGAVPSWSSLFTIPPPLASPAPRGLLPTLPRCLPFLVMAPWGFPPAVWRAPVRSPLRY